MSYIGRGTDKISNIEILDNITFDGSSSYSITKSSVAFVPNSAQSLLISIDGVVQATNFTVSSSTIDFGVAVPSTSTCDFFLHYGTGVLFTPADGTVTEAKIGSNAVTSAKLSYPLTTFSSTGIDDNATSTAITIDSANDATFVGTVTAGEFNFSNSGDLHGGTTASVVTIAGGTNSNVGANVALYGSTNGSLPNITRFRVNSTETMRIDSSGTLFVGVTSEPTTGDSGAQISNTIYHIFARNTSASAVFRAIGSSGLFQTLGNGNAQNTNNSYGSISDRELKENEVDANSQWNDIKALQIKNYNLKSEPNQTHLGVIAQDLEASGMNGLVEQNQDEIYSENDVLPEGKNIGDVKEKGYKTVKYSILYMKAVKALQEAMQRIETLETQRADLEARITALESE